MTYTQAQIDKANAVGLEKFLRAQGETLVRSGKEYRWKAHDSLTVCGNKWFRHSQSKGGLPVDFVMEFYGKSFPEAVQMLTGETGEAQPEADPAPSPAFRLPLRNVTNANILNYLTQERKLSPSLVNFFIAAGDIYEDSSHHNVVFVGRDADGHPRCASSRGIREKFRQDAAGAEKAFGFAHRGTDKQLLVFEAPIDLLSFIELFPKNWQQHSYLSLGGVSGKALQQFLSERPDVERVFLCLDADKAGEDACKRLAALLPDNVSVTRIPDGGVIQVDYPDGRSFTARVEHLDDYHFDMGGLGNVFHICQFAEVMERNHADFYPEIQTQDEQAAWELGGKGYLAIQSCEDGWDYTIYHSDYSVMDGGQLDAPELTIQEAREQILEAHHMEKGRRLLQDYDAVMDKVAEAEELNADHRPSTLEKLAELASDTAAPKSSARSAPEL